MKTIPAVIEYYTILKNVNAIVKNGDRIRLDTTDARLWRTPRVRVTGSVDAIRDAGVLADQDPQRFREDHLTDPDTCPGCGAKGAFTVGQIEDADVIDSANRKAGEVEHVVHFAG